ncbi:MAG: preprotein translocase subunit SecG [Christensenellales bacterium]|jgi:preprotein translocase subunit SecG
MDVLELILTIIMALSAVILIITVALQESKTAGVQSVMGGTDTYFGKGKSRGRQAKLIKITKISAIIFMVLGAVVTIVF